MELKLEKSSSDDESEEQSAGSESSDAGAEGTSQPDAGHEPDVGETPESVEVDGQAADGSRNATVRSVDLAGARRVERGRLPTLELIDARVADLVAREISRVVNKETSVEARVDGLSPCHELLERLESPGCHNLVEFETLEGFGLVSLELRLMFGLLEQLFGASEQRQMSDPELGERFSVIEQRFIRRLVRLFGRAVEEAWRPVVPVAMKHVHVENDPSNVAFAARGEWVIASSFGVQAGSICGEMTFALPFSLLADHQEVFASGEYEQRPSQRDNWSETLREHARGMPVELVGELGRTRLRLRELLGLNVDDVLRLDQSTDDPVFLSVQGVPKFRAEICVRHGNLSVELTSLHDTR